MGQQLTRIADVKAASTSNSTESKVSYSDKRSFSGSCGGCGSRQDQLDDKEYGRASKR